MPAGGRCGRGRLQPRGAARAGGARPPAAPRRESRKLPRSLHTPYTRTVPRYQRPAAPQPARSPGRSGPAAGSTHSA